MGYNWNWGIFFEKALFGSGTYLVLFDGGGTKTTRRVAVVR